MSEWRKAMEIEPFRPEQLSELHERNCRGAKSPITSQDLAEFLRNPELWRQTVWTEDDVLLYQPQALLDGVYASLGINCQVPPVPSLTKKQQKSLVKFGFRLFFIPAITESEYPASFRKPDWGRRLDASQVEHRPLKGEWVAVETIAKPNWDDPGGYPNDRLAAAVKLEWRFGVSWYGLHDGGFLQRIARVTGFPQKATRLPTAEEWNFLGNLFNFLRERHSEQILPDLGATNSWEWCENLCGSDTRLVAGHREDGGLAGVGRYWRGDPNDGIGFRVLVVL